MLKLWIWGFDSNKETDLRWGSLAALFDKWINCSVEAQKVRISRRAYVA
jgi:hypothetical protein